MANENTVVQEVPNWTGTLLAKNAPVAKRSGCPKERSD